MPAFPRPNQAFLWAFSATATAAASTVVYLLYLHGQEWGPRFLQLYTTIAMVSGWLNALIYFLAPRSIFLQTRKASVLFLILAIMIIAGVYGGIFHQSMSLERLIFTLGSLVPVLYANAFGIEFFEGNYPWPYKRVVILNTSYFLAAGIAFWISRTEQALYVWVGLTGAAFIGFWLFDRWNCIDTPRGGLKSWRPWVNPSVPVLERALWDQFILTRLDGLDWSFLVYLIGRIVTFTGNVTYSYLMGVSAKAHRQNRQFDRRINMAIILLAAPVAAAAVKMQWCAFLLGQIFAWLVTAKLTAEYNQRGRSYGRFLLIWLLDIFIRGTGLLVSQDVRDYALFLTFSSATAIILTVLVWRKKPSPKFRERASTISPPADFPNIR